MVFRKCAGCGDIKQRSELLRIMKIYNSDDIMIQPTSRHFGRSSYLCYSKECLKNALKKRRLQKTLKYDIPNSTLKYLESIINQ